MMLSDKIREAGSGLTVFFKNFSVGLSSQANKQYAIVPHLYPFLFIYLVFLNFIFENIFRKRMQFHVSSLESFPSRAETRYNRKGWVASAIDMPRHESFQKCTQSLDKKEFARAIKGN